MGFLVPILAGVVGAVGSAASAIGGGIAAAGSAIGLGGATAGAGLSAGATLAASAGAGTSIAGAAAAGTALTAGSVLGTIGTASSLIAGGIGINSALNAPKPPKVPDALPVPTYASPLNPQGSNRASGSLSQLAPGLALSGTAGYLGASPSPGKKTLLGG